MYRCVACPMLVERENDSDRLSSCLQLNIFSCDIIDKDCLLTTDF